MTSTSRELFLPQRSRSSSTLRRRRQPMTRTHVAEVAGGTTADLAAVCCCCPCGLVNLLVLVVYKLPAGLCRRVVRKMRRDRLMKKGMTIHEGRVHCTCGCERKLVGFNSVGFESLSSEFDKSMLEESDDESCDEEVIQLEKEMWDRFYGTGFWRSPTQRETPSVAYTDDSSDEKSVVKVTL